MTRPAVVGDEQLAIVKQHQQLANAAGVAGQVDAQEAAGGLLQLGGQLSVFAQANQADRKTGGTQALRHLGVMRLRPSPLGQDAAAGVHEHHGAALQTGVVLQELGLVGLQLLICKRHRQMRLIGERANGRGLVQGHGAHG